MVKIKGFADPLNIGLPRTINLMRFRLNLLNPFLNVLHHRLLEVLHSFSHKVFSKNETVYLVPEPILRIPDILFLDNAQVEWSDLLHAKWCLLEKLKTKVTHSIVIFQHLSTLVHEITHPLIAGFKVRFPLVLRQTNYIDRCSYSRLHNCESEPFFAVCFFKFVYGLIMTTYFLGKFILLDTIEAKI